MSVKSELLVFRHDYTESKEGVLVPIEVPENITLDNVRDWLPTLEKCHGYLYSVMVVTYTCAYDIKAHPKVLYAESVDAAAPPEYDPEYYI